jgi:hypothetical protein
MLQGGARRAFVAPGFSMSAVVNFLSTLNEPAGGNQVANIACWRKRRLRDPLLRRLWLVSKRLLAGTDS